MKLEVVEYDPTVQSALERAQIDVQVATAHRFPRSLDEFKRRALSLIGLDKETAASCIYHRPVGRDEGVQKIAEGQSVRLAEIVQASFGNIRVGATLVEMNPRFVRARGMAHDLESNSAATCEVVEPTVLKDGTPFTERQRAVVAKAALSKARRDAIFIVVPRAVCKPIYDEAKRLAVGTSETLVPRRAKAMEWASTLGVESSRVFAALGVKGIDGIGLDQLEILTGLRTAIRDGDVTAEEAFPPVVLSIMEAPAAPTTPATTPATAPPTLAVELPRRGRPPGSKNKPKETLSAPQGPAEPEDQIPGLEISAEARPVEPPQTAQDQLANIVVGAGFSFTDLQHWAVSSGFAPDLSGCPAFTSVPTAEAQKLLRAQAGLLAQLRALKKGLL